MNDSRPPIVEGDFYPYLDPINDGNCSEEGIKVPLCLHSVWNEKKSVFEMNIGRKVSGSYMVCL